MENFTIKNATAIYTGGGIYIYYGQLEDGSYFRACDEWDSISICNADTSTDEAEYAEFYNEHETESISGYDFAEHFNNIIHWILNNKPDGNYQAHELEERLLQFMEAPSIEIEDAQTLAETTQKRVKQEKFEQLLANQLESIKRCMSEYRTDCNFFFADGSQYRRDFEKQWRNEFYSSAVRLFESKGYRIIKQGNYTLITW